MMFQAIAYVIDGGILTLYRKEIDMNKFAIILFNLTITIYSSIGVSAAMQNDIIESAKEAKRSITTAYIVCIQEYNFSESLNDPDLVRRILGELDKNYVIESDTLIDCSNQKAKSTWTDLRDVASLIKSNNLPARSMRSLSKDRVTFIKNNYEMIYFPPGDGEPNNANLLLRKEAGPIEYILNLPYFGIIDTNLLDEKYSPAISEISVDGKNLIQINISYETPGGIMHGTIQCDPQIQFRYRSIVWTNSNGEKKSEVTASDYKDVNGIPYPFSYSYRQFVDGQFYREESYHSQKVQFNVILNDLDFKMFVPKGTPLTDLAISNRSPVIGLERFMGIEEALTMGRNMAQSQ